MDLLNRILYDAVYHMTPILLCVLGGLFAYKAGVLNIALEGMMLAGSFISVLVAMYTQNALLIYLSSIFVCVVLGLVFAFLAVNKRGNVIIIGLAINMIIPAVAGFVLQTMGVPNLTAKWINPAMFRIDIPLIKDIPILGRLFSGHPLGTYISFFMIFVAAVLLYKTKFGIYTRVVGERPLAAKSLGIRSNLYATLAILIGALLCAVAGLNLSYERLGIYTNGMTAGRGFIAIAAIYCGKGEPVKSSLYAFIFGIARALAINLSIRAGGVAALFDIIPYLLMIIILAINSGFQIRNYRMRTYW
ncbi:MAG TPA: ABC transporter permease [Clostridiaceae bacterium]|nr:ABC transporter permease [Clostridiaceae bacterium]